jgi:hypothetical protein
MVSRYLNSPNSPEHIVRRHLNAARLEIEARFASRHHDAGALVLDAIFAIIAKNEPPDADKPTSAARVRGHRQR